LKLKNVEKVEEWIEKASNLKIGKSFFLRIMERGSTIPVKN